MNIIQITLPETECERLRDLSQRTGKSEGELLREALDLLSAQLMSRDRLDRLRRAKGIWKDRDDLPELSELREGMNRF
jgi:Arc/MetJ-type ribon-helix-helix transcriptional regulator